MHFACAFYNYDLANLLVECGADVNAKENEKHTPLDITSISFSKIQQKKSDDPNYKEKLDNTNKIASLLLKHGGDARFYHQFGLSTSYKKNDKCNINADAIFDLGIANKSMNTVNLAVKFGKEIDQFFVKNELSKAIDKGDQKTYKFF